MLKRFKAIVFTVLTFCGLCGCVGPLPDVLPDVIHPTYLTIRISLQDRASGENLLNPSVEGALQAKEVMIRWADHDMAFYVQGVGYDYHYHDRYYHDYLFYWDDERQSICKEISKLDATTYEFEVEWPDGMENSIRIHYFRVDDHNFIKDAWIDGEKRTIDYSFDEAKKKFVWDLVIYR